MTREELEFRISEYLDGTLSTADRVALERRLGSDADTRRLLEEYRRVDQVLRTSAMPLPVIDYDALAGRISHAVAADEAASRPTVLFSFKLVRRVVGVGVAAAVVLAGSLWIHQGQRDHRVTLVEVTGPEVAAVQPVEEIEIGPSAAIAQHAPLGVQEAIMSGPRRLVIASPAPSDWGNDILPY